MNNIREDIFKKLKIIFNSSSLAVLATEDNGLPYTNLIGFLPSEDLKYLYFFTPRDTQKYKNIKNNANVSILIDNRDKNMDKKFLITAVTVIGIASIMKKFPGNIINRFLDYYPEFVEFIKPELNALIKVKIEKYILVNKLQQINELRP